MLFSFSIFAQETEPLSIRIELQNDHPRLVWQALPGAVYDAVGRDSLSTGAWEKVATIVSDSNSASWLDTRDGSRTRFYRLSQGAAGLGSDVTLIHSSAAPPIFMPSLTNAPYASVRSLLTSLSAFGPLRIPLPLPDIAAFGGIPVSNAQIYFDDANQSIAVSGAATLLNQPVELLFTASWGTQAVPSFLLGIKFSRLDLSMLSQGFAGTALAQLDFKNSVIILAQDEAVIDPLKLPGKAFSFYGGTRITVERGVNLFKEIDLSPLPIIQGLKVLGIQKTTLALQGIVGVDPNLFFNGIRSLDPAFLHLRSVLPNTAMPGQPSWVSMKGRRLDLSFLTAAAGGVVAGAQELSAFAQPQQLVVTVSDQITAKVGSEVLAFVTLTDLATLPQTGTTTLIGTTPIPWNQPLGIQWLNLNNLSIELILTDGEVVDGTLSSTFVASGKEGIASIHVPGAENGSVGFSLATDQLASSEIVDLLQKHTGLTLPGNDLPPALVLNQPRIFIQPQPALAFTITGKARVFGNLEADLLVTIAKSGGAFKPIAALQVPNFKLSQLIPATAGVALGDLTLPVGGFTSGEFSSGDPEEPVQSSDLDPVAQSYFAKTHSNDSSGVFTLPARPGLELKTSLPLSHFPSSVLQALNLNPGERVSLAGFPEITLGDLSGPTTPTLNQLHLEANLPLDPLPGIPAALQPVTVLGRKLILTYANGVLDLVLENQLSATLNGRQSVFQFRTSLASTPQGGSIQLVGSMATPWTTPFGLSWLNIENVQLRLAGSADAGQASLAGRIAMAGKSLDTTIELATINGVATAKFRATVDQLSLADFIGWVQERFGASPFGAQLPEGLLDLRQLTLNVQSGPKTQVTVSANTALFNKFTSKLLFTLVESGGQLRPIVSFGLEDFSLGSISPQLAGTFPGDLKFPSGAFTVSDSPVEVSSSELSPEAREFHQKNQGSSGGSSNSEFTLKAIPGISLGALLPASLLPERTRTSLGLSVNDTLPLTGPIGLDFGMMSGSSPVSLGDVDLSIQLPSAKPVLLPPWLPADPTVQRTIRLIYKNLPGPEKSLALRVTDRVGVNLDNARRTFVLSTTLSSAGELSFQGNLEGNWVKPFGVEWLTLEQVGLSVATDGTQSQGSFKSSFPLRTKTIALEIGIDGTPGDLGVKLTGSVNQLSIDDVIELVRRHVNLPLFPGSPPSDFATLNNARIIIRLGRTKSFSIGATASLAGRPADLLWSIETQAGLEPNILLGIQPQGWSVSSAFPSLSNPIVDSLSLPTPTLTFAKSSSRKESSQLNEEEKQFYGKSYNPGGSGSFSFKPPAGVGLGGSIPLSGLPPDNKLRELMKTLGMQGDTLLLEGSLGNALDLITSGGGGGIAGALKDLSLRIGLPPMRPNGSPEWFLSGQLALEITGAPSVGVAGEVRVKIENDSLTFFIESGISFPGPTLQLIGGVRANEPWISPFGVEWLTLNELTVLLGVDATGSAKLGFSGDMIVGEKDIEVTALIAVNVTGVPTNLILDGKSTEGFSMSDIVALQAHIASVSKPGTPRIPLERLPDMAVKNVALKFAPHPEPALGVEQGLAFSGDFYMQTQRDGPLQHVATTRMKVGEGEISASGDLITTTLGPITWSDPHLDLLLSTQQQHVVISGIGEAQVWTADLDLELSREVMGFDLSAKIFDQFQAHLSSETPLNLPQPNFPITAEMLQDFITGATAEFKAAFATVATQGQAAITEAQRLVNNVQALKTSKDLELANKIDSLTGELDFARMNMENSKAKRDSAYSALLSARSARDAAWNLYVGTPSYQVALKAERYSDYVAKAATYTARNAAYQTANTNYLAAKATYDAITPVEQNSLVVTLRAEIRDLTVQLETRRQQLAATTQTYQAVIEAVQQNRIMIENATFKSTLRAMIDTRSVGMTIVHSFAGVRQSSSATWDFRRSVRENLQPLINELLVQQNLM